MKSFLDRAVASAMKNVQDWKGRISLAGERDQRDRGTFLPETDGGCGIIAEIKCKSPSGGDLFTDGCPENLARLYQSGGAEAVSVVVEERHFGGSPELFSRVASSTTLPLLWKDFVVDEYQVDLAAFLGASSILLIAALLDDESLARFIEKSRRKGLRPLVEVHSEEELDKAVQAGADLAGVNNRDLETLQVDLGVSERLAPWMKGVVETAVSESGIRGPEDVRTMRGLGFRAVLVGYSLVTDEEPQVAVRKMVEAGRGR